jgi:hypothetical protein
MGRFIYADADRPSFRTEENRRRRDLAFLAWLRIASTAELDRLLWGTKDLPAWKRVAVARALVRQGA